MSILHVNQIKGYLERSLSDKIDMTDYANHTDAVQREKAFLTRGLIALAASHLSETPLDELANAITDGSKDKGIDLIYFDTKNRTLFLGQSKWHSNGSGSISLDDCLKFLEGVKLILEDDLGSANEKIKSRKSDIDKAIYDANAKFVLVLAHTGQDSLGEEIAEKLSAYIEKQNDTSELMSLRVMSQKELHGAVSAGLSGAPISIEIQMNGWGQLRDPQPAVYGRVCASDVAVWMEQHGNKLFDQNLRQFVGNSIVNQDIVNTLVTNPSEFWYFNNGITAVSSKLAKKPIGGNSSESGIFECTGFSVVNGAQTVGSIHAASKQDESAVAKAMVQVRIVSTAESRSSFNADVTRCTNTQNSVEKRDFVALDKEQERLRHELHIEGIEYAYKASAATRNSDKRFDLTEATVALACAAPEVGLSVQAKREISRLWDDLDKPPYKQLFNSSTSGPAIWEIVKIMRKVEKRTQQKAGDFTGRDSLICTHGNRFIQWAAMRKLQVKPGVTEIDVSKNINSAVDSAVAATIKEVKSSFSDSYPASLFKNVAKCRALAKSIVKI